MLVLSRKEGEQILIGGDIVITVVRISDDKVRIGVDAPQRLSVHRREVADAIACESQLPECRQTEGGITKPRAADDGRS